MEREDKWTEVLFENLQQILHLEELYMTGRYYYIGLKETRLYGVGNFLTVNLLAFQNWLCLMELIGLFIKNHFEIILMSILASSGGRKHIS
jgi:hypothetical protein